jgi:hypothetical protein
VCWSPDGMYVLTGGQDDLLSIWSLPDRQIVARCQGHDSWVTAVAFDPWRCDDRNYRFGSVGDDCKLLLWDFSVGMLHRPRGVSWLPYSVPTIECAPLCFSHRDKRVTTCTLLTYECLQASARSRGSVSAQSMSLQRHGAGSTTTANRLRSDSNRTQNQAQDLDYVGDLINHTIEPRARTAQLPPVMVSCGKNANAVLTCHLLETRACSEKRRLTWYLQAKTIDDHPLCWLGFEEDCIITSCQEG